MIKPGQVSDGMFDLTSHVARAGRRARQAAERELRRRHRSKLLPAGRRRADQTQNDILLELQSRQGRGSQAMTSSARRFALLQFQPHAGPFPVGELDAGFFESTLNRI
jgi:hypothetical protein